MKLDLVHDIQEAYRKVLNSMSRPGIIESLKNEEIKVDMDMDIYKSTFVIMLMLLDREVTFNIVSDNSSEISNLVSQMTYAKVKPIEEADYIFVIKDSCDETLGEICSKAKFGDLINPNNSSTIIAEFDCINNEGALQFAGPGIKEVNKVYISGNKNWIKIREMKNQEFPLGIDIICLDKNSSVLCIPRTTKINIKED